MKTRAIVVGVLLAVLVLGAVQAQQKSLASTLGVYVFPNGGQDASQQSKDEGECYTWAVQQAGVDPFQLADQAKAQQAQAQAQTQQIQAATQQQLDAFKKAFSVCLESKKYMVKF